MLLSISKATRYPDLLAFLSINVAVQVWSLQTVPHWWFWKRHPFVPREAGQLSQHKLQYSQERRKRSLSFTSALCRHVYWAEFWSWG